MRKFIQFLFTGDHSSQDARPKFCLLT